MQLFGFNLSWNRNGTTTIRDKYVRQEECHKAHEDLTQYLNARFGETKNLIEDLHKRIDDHQKAVMTYVDLLTKQSGR